MAKVKQLFEEYADIDEEKLFANLKYFLEAIMPVCDKYDINMAIHPDDPSWSVFGLPRIINNKDSHHAYDEDGRPIRTMVLPSVRDPMEPT